MQRQTLIPSGSNHPHLHLEPASQYSSNHMPIKVGMTQMNSPIKDLLPCIALILRNQESYKASTPDWPYSEYFQLNTCNTCNGYIFSLSQPWCRVHHCARNLDKVICFELLDLLKVHKKGICRAAVNSFGYIPKSLGPQDVLSALLTNLRVQEQQSRARKTVAISIVAETYRPFTCIPAILNEYHTAKLNICTGCLKALSFVFSMLAHSQLIAVILWWPYWLTHSSTASSYIVMLPARLSNISDGGRRIWAAKTLCYTSVFLHTFSFLFMFISYFVVFVFVLRLPNFCGSRVTD